MDLSSAPNDRLRQYREARGWSQGDLAEQLGVDRDTVSRWERGVQAPHPYARQMLGKLFGVPVEEFRFRPARSSGRPEPTKTAHPLPFSEATTLHWYLPPAEEAQLLPPETFIGREKEIDWLLNHLRNSSVTALIGMGGIGKTALAARVISRIKAKGAFGDGVVVESCQGQQDAAFLVGRILARFEPSRGSPPSTDLILLRREARRLLKGKDVLIVLENYEMGSGLSLKDLIVPFSVPSVKLLLLSREILSREIVPRESSYRLEPLPEHQALELFARAYKGKSARSLTAEEVEAATRILSILQRHTLAVKLAGSYAADYSLDIKKLPSILEHHAITLSDGGDEKATLASIFEPSIATLPEETRHFMAALAAFGPRGCGHMAAQHVGEALHLVQPWVHLDRLKQRSLLETWVQKGIEAADDTERVHFHPLIYALIEPEFAAWSPKDCYEIHAAIATYYASYIRKASQDALLWDELTIHEKLQWTYDHGYNELVVGLCAGMQYFWRDQWRMAACLAYLPWGIAAARAVIQRMGDSQTIRALKQMGINYGYARLLDPDRFEQAEEILRQILTGDSPPGEREASEGTAFFYLGCLTLVLKQPEEAAKEAQKYFQESLLIRNERQDEREWPLDFFGFCQVARYGEHLDMLEDYYRQALALDRGVGNRWGEAINLYSLGHVNRLKDRLKEAEECFLEAIKMAPQLFSGRLFSLEARLATGVVFVTLGELALVQGRLEEAEHHLQQSLQHLQGLRSGREESWARCYLGRLALARGQPVQARKIFQEAIDVAKEIHDQGYGKLTESEVLYYLAVIAEQEGGFDEAERQLRESLDMRRAIQDGPGMAQSCFGLGRFLTERRGKREQGVPLLEEAVGRYRAMGLLHKESEVLEWLHRLTADFPDLR